jgi:phage tail protein X
MRLTTVKKEASLDALADRLYSNLTPDSRKLAVTALVKANPALAQEGGLRPGVVVTLPDQPGLNLKTAKSDTDPVGTLTDTLKEAVQIYGRQLGGALDTAQADIKSQEALLKQKEVAAAIKASPDAADLAKGLAKTLQDRRTTYSAEAKTLDKVLKAIAKDLDSLI